MRADFVQSGDYAQIERTAKVLQGLLGEGAYIKRGDHTHPVSRFREAIDWVLAEVQRGISTQRYKGLGEMNPEQLWETTLCPDTRRLLQVRIEDRDQTFAIFNMLMSKREAERRCAWMEEKGDQVEADV